MYVTPFISHSFPPFTYVLLHSSSYIVDSATVSGLQFSQHFPIEFSEVTVICDVRDFGFPKSEIRWLFEGKERPQYLNQTTIVLSNVTRSETGNYTCSVRNMVNETTHTRFLDVVWSGKISSLTATDRPLIEHISALELYCDISDIGHPRSSILWYKDELLMGAEHENSSRVIINKVTRNDSGTYSCGLLNGVDRVMSGEVKVQVYCE